MTDRLYVVIPRWEEFQHRDMARTTVPPWIKTYTKLMGDDDFLTLSFHLRGLLVSIWLEYATARRQLSGSTSALTRRLGQRVTTRDLESLNQAGFIVLSASKPAGLEVEVEKTKDLSLKQDTTHHARENTPKNHTTTSASGLASPLPARVPPPTPPIDRPSLSFDAIHERIWSNAYGPNHATAGAGLESDILAAELGHFQAVALRGELRQALPPVHLVSVADPVEVAASVSQSLVSADADIDFG